VITVDTKGADSRWRDAAVASWATATLADEEQALIAEVGAFVASEQPMPEFASLGDRFSYLVGYQQRLHEAGLVVPSWPKELGGRDLGVRADAIVATALGAHGAPELINYTGTDVVGPALLQFAEPDRLTRLMPPIASAEELWCQLFSEPDAGSDLTSLRTRAEHCAGGWRINGQKVWSTWAPYADWGLLLARTGAPEDRHRALTAFVIDMRSPGIAIRPLRTMTGSAEFAEVFFEDVLVPADGVLGEVNGGWEVATVMLNSERGIYAVRRASVIAGALGRVLTLAADRALDVQTRHAIAQAFIDLRLLELRVHQLVDQLAAGDPIGPESALTKRLMTVAEQSVFGVATRLLGIGAMAWVDREGAAVVEGYLYSRSASIHGGTAEMQRNIIGERVLGLPRESVANPWPEPSGSEHE